VIPKARIQGALSESFGDEALLMRVLLLLLVLLVMVLVLLVMVLVLLLVLLDILVARRALLQKRQWKQLKEKVSC